MRLDILLPKIDKLLENIDKDDINSIEKHYPKIPIDSGISINGEDFDTSIITDYAFHKREILKKINEKNKNFEINITNINTIDEINSLGKELNKINDDLSRKQYELSYLYAYLGIFSEELKNRHGIGVFFKKAIKINPVHEQILLIENAQRSNNIEELEKIDAKTLSNISRKYKLIFNKGNITQKKERQLLKNALISLDKLEQEDKVEISKEFKKYSEKLNKIYTENQRLKEH